MQSISQPKVSVIMPVYNTEAYVREAIDSVLAQTLVDWELIIVNDGSTDGSLTILKEYVSIDDRVTLVCQENAGLSESRNSGVKLARGKYVYYLDSDDSILPNTLEQCFDNCEKYLLDFLFFDADINYEGPSEVNFKYSRSITKPDKVFLGIDILKKLLRCDEFFSSACLLFIRKEFIDKNNFSFLKGIVHEDELYTTSLFLSGDRVMYLPYKFFIRRVRANSIMTATVRMHNMNSYFIVADSLKEIVRNNPQFGDVIDIYLKKTLNDVLWKAHIMSFSDRLKVFQKALRGWASYITFRTWGVLLFKKYLPKK